MSTMQFLLQPHAPVLARDGRPFTADPGALAESLAWPLPSTLAGAMRTFVGNANGFKWSEDDAERVKQIAVKSPFMVVRALNHDWQFYLPTPADAVCYENEQGVKCLMRLSPWTDAPSDAGCNIPEGLLPLKITADVKPIQKVDYWSWSSTALWLTMKEHGFPEDSLPHLPIETRVNVSIDSSSGTSADGMLFSIASRCFSDVALELKVPNKKILQMAMYLHINAEALKIPTPSFIPFGGERRVSALLPAEGLAFPDSATIIDSLVGNKHLKLQLLTPALFDTGWKPGWLTTEMINGKEELLGNILSKIKVKLISVAIPRRGAVSGWDMVTNKPKAARSLVPAGSVYFFETEGALTEEEIKSLWLTSISDLTQDQLDGYGLVIPGIW